MPPKHPLPIPPNAFEALESLKQLLDSNPKYRFGIGVKRKSGEFLDQLALIVYVPEKKSPEQLTPSQMVPSHFEGFPTDVEQFQRILIADHAKYDILKGGIEIGKTLIFDLNGNGHMQSGTLGCIVRRRSDSRKYFLTCEHVASHISCNVLDPQGHCSGSNLHNYMNMTIYQPADETPSFVIGQCVDASINLDAAIIKPNSQRDITNTIQEIGAVRGKGFVSPWEPVWKRGRTTGLTNGLVRAILPEHSNTPTTLEIVGFPISAKFADHGDSGSVIVNSRQEVVGLLNSISDQSGTTAYATLIDPICDALNIDIAAGPVISSITPNSAVITSLAPVVIEGFGFDSPIQVTFGGVPAAIIQQSPTRLEVFPPPMLVSTIVDVKVQNKWGDVSEDGPSTKFEYLPIL
ncbi:IPT/TIG domain-containing protein [Bacillus sp. B15-48]|uniref:IPT/TIG domain-containing protein n=1 Tax=Bacillus sp. B15-48 TaxID=1548601 RepID=UPI00193EE1BC|nr:IPT/TIG domain-containing protein [Bacillus sp. B15-48]MBM4764824.1 hypothetical protein [Bacillus sp. B15-48]